MNGHFARTQCGNLRHLMRRRRWRWAAVRRQRIKINREEVLDITIFDAAISPVEREGSEHDVLARCCPRRDDHVGSFAWGQDKLGQSLRIFLKAAVPANLCKRLSAELQLEVAALRCVHNPPSLRR